MRTAAAMTQHCRAAAAVRGVNLGRSTHFCVHARCFLRNDMKTRWFTVDKDNLEPCLLIQNAKYSILKPSLSAPPSKHFVYDLLFGACPDIYVSYVLYPMISFGRSLTYPILNTQNMTNPTIVSPVKMEYG